MSMLGYLVQGLGSLVQAGEWLGCSLSFCYGPVFFWTWVAASLLWFVHTVLLVLCKPTAHTYQVIYSLLDSYRFDGDKTQAPLLNPSYDLLRSG